MPFTLPGETVPSRIKSQGTVMSITTPSPDRQEPHCRHFGPDGVNGTCGSLHAAARGRRGSIAVSSGSW